MSTPYAIVTGASQGLGKAFAFQLADKGYNLILLSAQDDGLDEVSAQISRVFNIYPICFEGDLTDQSFLLKVAKKINKNYKVNLLINMYLPLWRVFLNIHFRKTRR